MTLYEITQDRIAPLSLTTFAVAGVRERSDLQRLLREQVEIISPDTLVVAEEFGEWEDSRRRIDLLGLDRDANLVVMELKRTEDGGHMELQALRYAAMVSAMTFDQAVNALARSRSKAAPDHDAAHTEILTFLGWRAPDEDRFAPSTSTRVLLAAADFSKEITTAVLWLRDFGIDIRCIRLKPYRTADGKRFLDIQRLIPLPEAEEFQTKLGEKRQAERLERTERRSERYEFWESFLARPRADISPYAKRNPHSEGGLTAGIGRTGFSLYASIRQADCSVELWIPDNKPAFQKLLADRKAIEEEFGGKLDWRNVPSAPGSSIRVGLDGGYRSPREQWDEIQERLMDAAIRLDKVFRPRVQAA